MNNSITAKEILIVLCIFCIGWFLDDIFRKLFKKRKQTCFVYCPRCKNELISSHSFVEDRDGIVKYKCSKCGNVSFWDFAHFPVPYLRTCASDCEHFHIEDTYYGCDRKSFCDPDSMVEFKQRRYADVEDEPKILTEKAHEMFKELFSDLDVNDLKITIDNKRTFIWDGEKKEFIDISEE